MEFKLKEYHRNIPEKELIEDLQRVSKMLNQNTVSVSQYMQYGKYDYGTYKKRFSSWQDALIKSELKLHNLNNIKTTDEELMKNIEEVWIKLGKQPSVSDLQKNISKYSIRPYLRRFGTWMNSLRYFIEYINNYNEEFDFSTNNVEKSHTTNRNINLRLRFLVMKRDNFKCSICGRSPANTPNLELHIDHIKPWSKGGETIIDNLQTLCSDCNLGKSDLI